MSGWVAASCTQGSLGDAVSSLTPATRGSRDSGSLDCGSLGFGNRVAWESVAKSQCVLPGHVCSWCHTPLGRCGSWAQDHQARSELLPLNLWEGGLWPCQVPDWRGTWGCPTCTPGTLPHADSPTPTHGRLARAVWGETELKTAPGGVGLWGSGRHCQARGSWGPPALCPHPGLHQQESAAKHLVLLDSRLEKSKFV